MDAREYKNRNQIRTAKHAKIAKKFTGKMV